MFCSNCGAEINEDSNFCMKCGQPIKGSMEQGPPKLKERPTEDKKSEGPDREKNDALAVEYSLKKKLDEPTVVNLIERLIDKKDYHSLRDLEKDVTNHLKKERYILTETEFTFIKDAVLKHGRIGRFSIDEIIIRKVGGGRKAAILVTVLIVLVGAVVTEILIPMMGERIMNEPPTAHITSPENKMVLSSGQVLLMSGTASDEEDKELLGSNFLWTSDIDGELGIGSSKSISTLSPGTHTITLTVKDSQGATVSESVVVTIQARKMLHELTLPKTVKVGEEEETAFIRVWEPLIDESAPSKGWLEMENPFYKISVNLDHSYYLIYDKELEKDILIYNDKVENKMDMLTGSDIGFADLDANNQVPYSTTARDDVDGIRRYTIQYEDKVNGFLLVGTEGWDFQVVDPGKGYDMEAEVHFGIFADEPYYVDATEINNLQAQGSARPNDKKNPNEVIKSWVLTGEYSSASISGGDPEHLNKMIYEPYYEVQSLGGERKPWHAGSAEISKMFPDHVLIGNRLGGAVVFSLPQGRFRWDDSFGVAGGQVAAEFILTVERPEKAVAFSVDPVSRETFLYDSKDYSTIPGYAESLGEICSRYGLSCVGTLSPKDYDVKRFAYVVTLSKDWYDGSSNMVKDGVWADADSALQNFKEYEDTVYQMLRSTRPLVP